MADSELSEPKEEQSAATAKGEVERTDLSRRQLAVARRLAESKATIPHGYVSRRVRVPGTMTQDALPVVIVAAARALRKHRAVNGAYRDAALESYARINVGVTVESDDGPQVPTLFDADQLDHGAVAAELSELAGLVAEGKLTSPQSSGATFSVSAAGQGADAFAGAVTPGQAAHLCVSGIRDGRLTLTLCFDLRALRPPDAAEFLGAVASGLDGSTPRRA